MNGQPVVAQHRFRDPGYGLWRFDAEDIYVVCPRCGHRAVSRRLPEDDRYAPRRLTCAGCGHTKTTRHLCTCWDRPVDPHFRLPFWLQAECCGGHTLWAVNEAHLDMLEVYVAARLRERALFTGCSRSMIEDLPTWLKSAKHRDEVLRTIRRLRATLI